MLLNFRSLLLNTFVYERIKRINAKKRKRENRRKVDKKEKNQKKELTLTSSSFFLYIFLSFFFSFMLLFFSSFFLCYFDIVFIAVKILLLPCHSLYNITIVLKRIIVLILYHYNIAPTIIYCFCNILLKPDRIKIKGEGRPSPLIL